MLHGDIGLGGLPSHGDIPQDIAVEIVHRIVLRIGVVRFGGAQVERRKALEDHVAEHVAAIFAQRHHLDHILVEPLVVEPRHVFEPFEHESQRPALQVAGNGEIGRQRVALVLFVQIDASEVGRNADERIIELIHHAGLYERPERIVGILLPDPLVGMLHHIGVIGELVGCGPDRIVAQVVGHRPGIERHGHGRRRIEAHRIAAARGDAAVEFRHLVLGRRSTRNGPVEPIDDILVVDARSLLHQGHAALLVTRLCD